MREQLFLFVRPPRPLWPFNGPSTAFWPPLAFASLAAALREQVRGLRVAILDAPACAMGWNTLAQEVQRLQPDYIGIGEEAVSCVEGLRIAKMAKSLGAGVVAGGCFFGNVAPQALATGLIDVVVQGEGEQTIVELMSVLPEGRADALRRIAGISFRDGEETVFTGWREPMADLDRLPLPAYDLLPVERYGRSSRNHPAMAAIELSRGCTHACQFCALWRQMGRFRGDQPVPCLRVKSPERLVEEVRVLMDRYNRRYLGWVDPCFNAHPNVPRQLAELLLREERKIGQSAWVRADYLLRDEASGALSTCCDAGLNELYLGMERVSCWDLSRLGKGNLNGEPVRALEMLDAGHPDVVTVGSFIYGLEGDTPESVADLFRAAQQLPIDEIIFIPLTPLPGTPYWNPAMWDATGEKLRSFDFLPRPKGDKAVDSLTAAVSWSYFTAWPWPRVRRMLGGLFAVNPRRRSIARHILTRTVPLTWAGLFAASQEQETTTGMLYPEWYES